MIAGGAAVAAELLHDQAQGRPLARIVEHRRGGLGVGGGSDRIAGGEGGLGGADVQVREPAADLVRADDLVQARARIRSGPARPRPASSVLGGGGGLQGGALRLGQLVGGEVVGEGGGRPRVGAPSPRAAASAEW